MLRESCVRRAAFLLDLEIGHPHPSLLATLRDRHIISAAAPSVLTLRLLPTTTRPPHSSFPPSQKNRPSPGRPSRLHRPAHDRDQQGCGHQSSAFQITMTARSCVVRRHPERSEGSAYRRLAQTWFSQRANCRFARKMISRYHARHEKEHPCDSRLFHTLHGAVLRIARSRATTSHNQ